MCRIPCANEHLLSFNINAALPGLYVALTSALWALRSWTASSDCSPESEDAAVPLLLVLVMSDAVGVPSATVEGAFDEEGLA